MATTRIFLGTLLGIVTTIGACKQLNGQAHTPEPESEAAHKTGLSNWYLTVPIDSDNNKVDFIEQSALGKYRHMDRVRLSQYDGLDNALVFYSPYSGLPTPDRMYSRTELREQMEPVLHDPTVRIRASDQDAYTEVRCYSLSLRH